MKRRSFLAAVCVVFLLFAGCREASDNPWQSAWGGVAIKVVELDTGERILVVTCGAGSFQHVDVIRLDDSEAK
jgi:hypothetical protein